MAQNAPADQAVAEASGPVITPTAAPTAIPTPKLKPGETITWVKVEPPKLALGEIVVGSFALAGTLMLVAIGLGVTLGHLRSHRRPAGATSLDLRNVDPESPDAA